MDSSEGIKEREKGRRNELEEEGENVSLKLQIQVESSALSDADVSADASSSNPSYNLVNASVEAYEASTCEASEVAAIDVQLGGAVGLDDEKAFTNPDSFPHVLTRFQVDPEEITDMGTQFSQRQEVATWR